MYQTVIVVPCYNEAKRLQADRFIEFGRANPSVRFLFVNDGSSDETLKALSAIQDVDPGQFQVLDLSQNVGKAEAVRRGVLAAAEDDIEFVGYWDADLATGLDAIVTFADVLDRREQIDLVLGSRFPLLGRDIVRRPVRKFIGRGFALVTSAILRHRIRDTQCGAKMLRVNSRTIGAFQKPFLTSWIFDVELVARLMSFWERSNCTLQNSAYELPLDQWQEVPGSKLRLADFFNAFFELGKIYWHYFRPFARPYGVDLSANRSRPIADESMQHGRAA